MSMLVLSEIGIIGEKVRELVIPSTRLLQKFIHFIVMYESRFIFILKWKEFDMCGAISSYC